MKFLIVLMMPIAAFSQTFIIDKAVIVDYADSTVYPMTTPIIVEFAESHVTVTSSTLEETFNIQYKINKRNLIARTNTGEIALLEIITNKITAFRIRYSNKTYTFYAQ
jgi:hypothetical protein